MSSSFCTACGAQNRVTGRYCRSCGNALDGSAQALGGPRAVHRTDRPIGIVLIAVNWALAGFVLGLVGGVAALLGAEVPAAMLTGTLMLVLGTAAITLAYGLWALAPWSYTASLWLNGIGGLLALGSIAVDPSMTAITLNGASILLAAAIHLYLKRPDIAQRFRTVEVLTSGQSL